MTFGLLSIDKPRGPTSHDMVAAVRRGTGERRVGHAGTLDPLACGVLVLALGRATRLLEYLAGSDKSYRAELTLGVVTDTYDAEGVVVAERPLPHDLTHSRVEAVLNAFRGRVQQVPPVYSAVKVSGRAAHARARAGEVVMLEPREVTIYSLELVRFDPPNIALSVTCSAGTYVRSLAHDLGEALGCGATLSTLTRMASGRFRREEAVGWEALQMAFSDGSWVKYLLPADLALDGTPRVPLDEEGMGRVTNGMPMPAEDVSAGLGRAYAPDGRFVAVLEGDPVGGVWRPRKVFT